MTPSDMPLRTNFGGWTDFVIACGDIPRKPYFCEEARRNSRAAHKRKRSFNWKGGRITDNKGYVHVWMPSHPNARMGGYVQEHRLVMSNHIGRPLEASESVHHKNGIRADNKIENLELWVSMQPAGQRVSDLISFAKEVLAKYENPELLENSDD